MRKNILVTGGAGYIGSHTVVALYEAGYNPVVVDNLSHSHESVMEKISQIIGDNFDYIIADIATEDNHHITDTIPYSIDAIIHFAAHKSVPLSVKDPLEYYRNNLCSMMNMIDMAKRLQIPIIFSSSCSVYGEPDVACVTETTPLKPAVSPYGNTKRVCEDMLLDAVKAYGIAGISLRYFNPIGAHPSALIGELPIGTPGNLIPRLTNAILEDEPITIFGIDYPTPDGTCIRDYVYVGDLADAHVASLEFAFNWLDKNPEFKDLGFYEVFNVGTGKGTSVLELLNDFEKATGEKIATDIQDRRAGDVVEVYADTTKINTLLNWFPTHDIRYALKTAWSWANRKIPTS